MTLFDVVFDAPIDGTPITPRWLSRVQVWRPTDTATLRTGAVETAAVLLGGTFDLVANGTSWPARGARQDPFGGRPMAVFLPPEAEFTAANGTPGGELLLVSARRPAPAPAAEGQQSPSHKPLLQLAGSNKSFDAATGEWRPAETFPDAAESLPPRRIQRLACGDLVVERVFAPDYKAATLSLDELVVPAGATLRLADLPQRPHCDEALLFVRSPAGDRAQWCRAEHLDAVVITAERGPSYVAIAYAGK